MNQKKTVDFCKGCPDNRERHGDGAQVFCLCAKDNVSRFFLKIERGDKNRDKYCTRRRNVVQAYK